MLFPQMRENTAGLCVYTGHQLAGQKNQLYMGTTLQQRKTTQQSGGTHPPTKPNL